MTALTKAEMADNLSERQASIDVKPSNWLNSFC